MVQKIKQDYWGLRVSGRILKRYGLIF